MLGLIFCEVDDEAVWASAVFRLQVFFFLHIKSTGNSCAKACTYIACLETWVIVFQCNQKNWNLDLT